LAAVPKYIDLQVLGFLVRGDGSNSFVTSSAISTVFSTWHALASSWAENEMPAMVGGLEACFFSWTVWRQDFIQQLLEMLDYLYSAARLSKEVGACPIFAHVTLMVLTSAIK